MMKIMITGNTGQLGSDAETVLGRNHEILAMGHAELDITNRSAVETMVQGFAPDIILNCAGYTQVDRCEIEKKRVWAVNVKGPENLGMCLRKFGGQLIHISSDYVFNGMKKTPRPYLEEDAPNPLSYYGITKLESEKTVRRTIDRHMILRTAWMYGSAGTNFLKTMLERTLKNPGGEIKVVDDQYGSPTWSYRLAMQISTLINNNGRGTYHATAEGYCTWYESAKYFLEKMKLPHNLVPCASQEYPTPATRPKNSILENRRLKETKINIMKHWQEDMDQFVHRFREHLINEAVSQS